MDGTSWFIETLSTRRLLRFRVTNDNVVIVSFKLIFLELAIFHIAIIELFQKKYKELIY